MGVVGMFSVLEREFVVTVSYLQIVLCHSNVLSFKDRKHSHDTVLSKHIGHLRDSNTSYEIKWQESKCLQRKPFPLQFMSD